MFNDMYITNMRRIDDTIIMDFSFKADANDSDYELYIYYPCPLRISQGNNIILGSFDIDCVIDETDDDSWNIKDNNMYDINVRDRILPVLPQKVTASNLVSYSSSFSSKSSISVAPIITRLLYNILNGHCILKQ